MLERLHCVRFRDGAAVAEVRCESAVRLDAPRVDLQAFLGLRERPRQTCGYVQRMLVRGCDERRRQLTVGEPRKGSECREQQSDYEKWKLASEWLPERQKAHYYGTKVETERIDESWLL